MFTNVDDLISEINIRIAGFSYANESPVYLFLGNNRSIFKFVIAYKCISKIHVIQFSYSLKRKIVNCSLDDLCGQTKQIYFRYHDF